MWSQDLNWGNLIPDPKLLMTTLLKFFASASIVFIVMDSTKMEINAPQIRPGDTLVTTQLQISIAQGNLLYFSKVYVCLICLTSWGWLEAVFRVIFNPELRAASIWNSTVIMAEKKRVLEVRSANKLFSLKVIHVILLRTHRPALVIWLNPMARGHKRGSFMSPEGQ